MCIPAESIGLPDCEFRPVDRFATEIEDASGNFDDFSLRESIGSPDCRQVALRGRPAPYREVGTQILVRRPVSILTLVHCFCRGSEGWE